MRPFLLTPRVSQPARDMLCWPFSVNNMSQGRSLSLSLSYSALWRWALNAFAY